MSIPSALHSFANHLRAIEPTAERPPCLLSTQPGCLALAMTLLMQEDHPAAKGQTHLLIVPTQEEAEQLYEDLKFFCALMGRGTESLSLFPPWATVPYNPALPTHTVICQRVRALHRLSQRTAIILVSSLPAVLHKLIPPATFQDACFALRVGDTYERDWLLRSFIRLGYQRGSLAEIPGEFSVRGGIVDIFSTAQDDPVRIEFLGDTVESIRTFDPSTQESLRKLKEIWVLPTREFIPPLDEAGPLSTDPIPSSIEWDLPRYYPELVTLPEYITTAFTTFLYRSTDLDTSAAQFWNNLLETWEHLDAEFTDISSHSDPDQLYEVWDTVKSHFSGHPTILLDSVAPDSTTTPHLPIPVEAQSPASVGLGVRGIPFRETLAKLDQLRSDTGIFLVARSPGQVERLLSLLHDHGFPANRWQKPFPAETSDGRSPFYCLEGDLSAGFIAPHAHIAFVTEEELFGKGIRHRPHTKSTTAKFFSSLDDLKEGDLVVHLQHGIGRYLGLKRLDVQNCTSDYLLLEFAGTDTLYVPLDRLNHIHRYRGADQRPPRLDRLGGASWGKTKAKVKKGIEDMTEELVELYANREVARRSAYQEDSLPAQEFEAGFEYEETPDQIKAIEEICRDLESPKPMDRLVCGDVGYGKTEVAMRAAFKAIQANRQVAVLVPTTLLAQQHFETFTQRFAPFPVKIGVLSRFQNAQELKSTIKEIGQGVVDIVIGTHRLLQKDIVFKQLGLVIIDEEQWFGVRHKERLKQLRTQVDVLTLSATPIPRTLQMAFSGVRDLSVIETAPTGRLAVETQVLRFDATVIREAILRELHRGGQAYFVHNRVETMEQTGAWLQELVPEARVLMAHGQMDEQLLERVMLRFFHHEADVLLASAIIQSGLDIPNANTILVDRAELFGLSQLYQLRGRVGRGGQQAYAYLFIPNEETLSTDAQKRLNAIQEFAELGSGFRIAAADLEIRGAGNLLGKQQSGSIAAVGLDLYLQLVEQAVQQIKGQEIPEEWEPTLQLDVSAFIPENYVEDTSQRLGLYKRLSGSDRLGDLALLYGETLDRFGSPPDPMERLFEVMQIKVLAKALKLEYVEVRNSLANFRFHEQAKIPEKGIQALMEQWKGRIQFLSPRAFRVTLPNPDWATMYPQVNTILQSLFQSVSKAEGTAS
ncbi:MAG: transcription-repair coupling factor [Nitrospirales bacterium]|nr:transcription-repair coupling factor [Nitrospirales bacterium]